MTTTPEAAAAMTANLKVLRKALDNAHRALERNPSAENKAAAQAAWEALQAAPRPLKANAGVGSRNSLAAKSGRRQHAEQAARTAAAMARRWR